LTRLAEVSVEVVLLVARTDNIKTTKEKSKTMMSSLYKKQEDIATSVEIRHISGGKVVLDFSADSGKFGTDEMLDGYTLTAERLLMVLQHSDIITDEENYS
tara:strand:+ start:561 stop:863 length:303 start_codon:yes stop_codon:yes gene_type:complete